MLHKSSHVIITSTSNQYLKNQLINTNQTVFQYKYRQRWLLYSNTFSHNNKSIDLKVLQYILSGISPPKWITSTFSQKSSLTYSAVSFHIRERGKKEMKTQNLRCSKKSNPRVTWRSASQITCSSSPRNTRPCGEFKLSRWCWNQVLFGRRKTVAKSCLRFLIASSEPNYLN